MGKDQIEKYGIEPFVKNARILYGNIRACGEEFSRCSRLGLT